MVRDRGADKVSVSKRPGLDFEVPQDKTATLSLLVEFEGGRTPADLSRVFRDAVVASAEVQ